MARQTNQGEGGAATEKAGKPRRWRLRRNYKGRQNGETFNQKDVQRLGLTDDELKAHFEAID